MEVDKKKLIIILTLLIFSFVVIFLFFFPDILRYPIIYIQLNRLFENNKDIISINASFGWDGSSNLNQPLTLDIKLKNNKRIFLTYITSLRLKEPFYIDLVGESVFKASYVLNNNTIGVDRIPVSLIAQEIGIEISSVNDVIVNYSYIYSFIDSLTKYDINDQLVDSVSNEWMFLTRPIESFMDNRKVTWYLLNIKKNDLPNFYNYYIIEEKYCDFEFIRNNFN